MKDKKPVRVRIVNDGKPSWATQITDAETGKGFEHVTRVELTLDVNDQRPSPVAVLTTILPEFDVIVDAEVRHVCPVCGQPIEEEEKSVKTL